MDSNSLQTASQYINNLLLSRGLLRDACPIEFGNLSREGGGKEANMAKIINLVHDMILRRDRETETFGSLSQALCNSRAACAQQARTISKLETGNADLERQLSLAKTQEKSANSNLKHIECRNKTLREDMNRLKVNIGQIRAQCANDIRKRDVEITRLKKYLEGRRIRDASSQVGITVITPGAVKPQRSLVLAQKPANVDSPSYSLKEESTEFLTQLSQSLSDENDAMISLIQCTLQTLQELQGLSEHPSVSGSKGNKLDDPIVSTRMPPSYEILATKMNETLEHLRILLTNPSFVPLEEVEVREEEIMHLREGWEKMELRWREAVSLMNSWRKRILESGDTINLDDLRKGLRLDSENPLPARSEKRQSLVSCSSSDSNVVFKQDTEWGGAKAVSEPAEDVTSPMKEQVRSMFPVPGILESTSGNARPPSSRNTDQLKSASNRALLQSSSDEDDVILLDKPHGADGPSPPKKRRVEDLESSLTIEEKLNLAEREAAKVKEMKRKPQKRTAIPRKMKSTRRSTLSPEDLEGMIGLL